MKPNKPKKEKKKKRKAIILAWSWNKSFEQGKEINSHKFGK